MELGIKGKTAVVLGASQGLGRAIAELLAEEGVNLVVCARNQVALTNLCHELSTKYGVSARVHPLDMTDPDSVTALCEKIEQSYQPDILINNAGGPPPSGALGVADAVWNSSVQALLLSVIQVTESAVKGMRDQKWGRVLTIASSGVIQPIPNLAVSNTVRAAVVGFSKSLSNEIARDGVTVNVIAPGRIDTPRVEQIDTAKSKKENKDMATVRSEFAATVPMGRYGTPQEFANMAVFLVSERASYVTGHIARVDGGSIRSV
jgi:3-oxoacyl-[acyl-carrier protein] reductase